MTNQLETMNPTRSEAFTGLCLMCLATGLFIVFRNSLPDEIHPEARNIFTVLAALLLFGVSLIGLGTYLENLTRASQETCNRSVIGGLIAANLGVLYISLCSSMSLESKVSYVAWPTYLGLLVGYWWA